MTLPLVLIAVGIFVLGLAAGFYRRLVVALEDDNDLVAIHGRRATDSRRVENRWAPSGNR